MGRPEGLYKADGKRIANPTAYIAKFETNGQNAPLFNARGQEVRNPAAYVAKMLANEKRPSAIGALKELKPNRMGGQESFYTSPKPAPPPGLPKPPIGSGRPAPSVAPHIKAAPTRGTRARPGGVKVPFRPRKLR